MTEIPDELRELHHRLRTMHFRPRPSLEPEVLRRLQHGDTPRGSPSRWSKRNLAIAAIALFTAAGALSFWLLSGRATVTVDRCCYDLDGGGPADDGVLVLARRDSKVHRLRVYEDFDGSGSFTPGDLVRLDRGEKPAMLSSRGEGIVTTERCCIDFDGGGPDDDGLLVIGVPPNRVLMAAIYEAGPGAGRRTTGEGWLLR